MTAAATFLIAVTMIRKCGLGYPIGMGLGADHCFDIAWDHSVVQRGFESSVMQGGENMPRQLKFMYWLGL